jgi:hypothetical protein
MSNTLTREEVEHSLPATLKSAATQQLTDRINTIVADPIVAQGVRDNFISYASVLRDGRFKTTDYLNAVVFVSYKLMGLSNQESYQKTFPKRYAALKAKGVSDKDISAYVAAYSKGKLPNLILEQTLIPVHVLNQDVYQKAINVQADLMINANSEKVRSDAANSILTHLAKPKEAVAAAQINVNVNPDSGINELKDLLAEVARKQREAIDSGVSTRDIAAQPLIEGKVEEIKR